MTPLVTKWLKEEEIKTLKNLLNGGRYTKVL